jgi:nicotinate-nucleotide pyrophosphorylase (carboxylating)
MENYLDKTLKEFYTEDDLYRHSKYINSLPNTEVNCHLKLKSDMRVAGLEYFFAAFNYLLADKKDFSQFMEFEGVDIKKEHKKEIIFKLPFNVALTGERIALNLLQHASSIATYTNEFVQKAGDIKILDTRKTLPGLRAIEKYAVTVGGGYNHRYGQTDMWMIKDNHKTMFGGLKEAFEFFKGLNQFYTPILAEIHNLEELNLAYELGIKHVMLDNFYS